MKGRILYYIGQTMFVGGLITTIGLAYNFVRFYELLYEYIEKSKKEGKESKKINLIGDFVIISINIISVLTTILGVKFMIIGNDIEWRKFYGKI